MPTRNRFALPAAVAASLLAAVPALAETLRCRSVNGNTTCSGTGAVSCQTINGRTTCTSGGGGVVQQFGGAAPAPRSSAPPAAEPDDEAETEADERLERHPPLPRPRRFNDRRLSVERHGPSGEWLSLEREGGRLRLRTERLGVDLD